jgi:hypothetical protein
MKRIVLFLLCLLSIAPLSAAPLNKAQVDAGAKWLLHLDLEAFKKSSFGSLALTEIQSQHGNQIAALEELLGSNLLKDLDQITLFGPDSDDKNAVLMVWGRFNPQKLLALLGLNATYEKSDYRNYTIHQWVDQEHGKNQVGAFAREDLIVLSQTRLPVEQALDTLDGKRPSLAQSGGLAFLDKAPAQPIVLLAAEDLNQLVGDNAHAAVLKNSQIMVFAAAEENQTLALDLDLWTQDAQTAVQIEQAFVGMKAFAMLNQKNQPLLGRLAEAFQIRTENTLVSIRFRYPAEPLFSILKEFKTLREEIQNQSNPQPRTTDGASS